MTNKEYFQQAFWIDIQKETLHEETESLRPFAEKNEKAAVLLERIEAELEAVLRHQAEIREVIAALPSEKERAALRCRYLCRMKWSDIAAELDVDLRTARRWHDAGIAHAKIPIGLSPAGGNTSSTPVCALEHLPHEGKGGCGRKDY